MVCEPGGAGKGWGVGSPSSSVIYELRMLDNVSSTQATKSDLLHPALATVSVISMQMLRLLLRAYGSRIS